jgi:beta-galactosidase
MRYLIFTLSFFFSSNHLNYAQNINQQFIAQKKLYYGAAYYAEAWDKSEIKKDIEYMRELNMNVMRIAEFSWALMEPEEGKYEFEWLHDIVDELHRNGIEVILGTPTATPPIWMASNYPEIFVTDENGERKGHGARRNCRYTSKIYQKKSIEICEAMAKEFGRKPGIIAWQTDNEFGLSPDFSSETQELWHEWLREKYNSIDTLNTLWSLNLWSQKYQEFNQIPMPKSNIWHHPSLRLDWVKFSEDQLIKYQDLQLRAIRKYSDLPITHDGMPGQQIDYPRLFKDLDFATTNVYHSFQVYNRVQGNYDRLRGYKKGMHWLFETAPNYSGGGPHGNTWFIHQPRGAMRAAIWMNYAMGGQGSLFWLWRQQPAGQEMPHGAILSAWGKPAANYPDLKELGKEISTLSDVLMDHPVTEAEVALIYDHNSDKALRIEEMSNGIKYYEAWTELFYRPVSDAFIHRDVISFNNNLEGYKVLLLPIAPVIPEDFKIKLKNWVEAGGTLMLGPMAGYRNEFFAAQIDHALGNIEPWMGIEVESRLPIDPFAKNDDARLEMIFNDDFDIEPGIADLWSEALASAKGKVVAKYHTGMQDGLPAIIENDVGLGKVVMLGSFPGQEGIRKLVIHYCGEKGIEPMASGDSDILMVPRETNDGQYYFIINLKNEPKNLMLPINDWYDELNAVSGDTPQIVLRPYDVMLIRASD